MSTPSDMQRGRVLLSLNANPQSESSIQAATQVASALHREVVGLFIQEDLLLEITALPVVATLSASGKPVSAMSPELMRQEIERQARRWRQLLSTNAEAVRVNWSFSRHSGELTKAIMAEYSSGDFLVLQSDETIFNTTRLPQLIDRFCTLLYGIIVAPYSLQQNNDHDVVLLLENTNYRAPVLDVALRLTKLTGSSLQVLIMINNNRLADETIAAVKRELSKQVPVRAHRLLPESALQLGATLRYMTPAYVVCDINSRWFRDQSTAGALCRTIKAPVVLVKGSSEDETASGSMDARPQS